MHDRITIKDVFIFTVGLIWPFIPMALLRLFIEKDGKSILIEGFPAWLFLVALVIPCVLLIFVKPKKKFHFFLYFFFTMSLFVTISFENFNAAFDRSNSEYFKCELISKAYEGRGYKTPPKFILQLGQCTPPLSFNKMDIDSEFYNLLNPPTSITIETRQGAFGYPFIKNYYVTK